MNERKKAGLLIGLACLLYFTSYITRLNYGAALADILEKTALTKSQGGVVSTALFFTYGFGQLVSGVLGDKLKPDRIILAGLFTTTVCNALFPLFGNVAALTVIWGINGFAQAMFWPPLVKIMAENLPRGKFTSACCLVTVASQLATVAVFLLVPLVLSTLNWQSVFYLSAGFAVLVAVLWVVGYRVFAAKKGAETDRPAPTLLSPGGADKSDSAGGHTAPGSNQAESSAQSVKAAVKPRVPLKTVLLGCGMLTILPAISMQGFLKDGITTWMPTYITETFSLEATASILMSVVLPIFSIGAIYAVAFLYKKLFRDELTAAACFFAVGAGLALLLFFFSRSSAVVSIGLSSLVVACMHGINLMLVTYVPSRFARFGKVSTVSGLTNSFTYVGSALSSYLTALAAERLGWRYTVLIWCAVAAVGVLLCALSYRRWKTFRRDAGSR